MAIAVTSLTAIAVQNSGLLLCDNQCALKFKNHVRVLGGGICQHLQILLNHHNLTICLNRSATVATLHHLQTLNCIFPLCHRSVIQHRPNPNCDG